MTMFTLFTLFKPCQQLWPMPEHWPHKRGRQRDHYNWEHHLHKIWERVCKLVCNTSNSQFATIVPSRFSLQKSDRSNFIDSQLPSLISLFIFVWSISEMAVVSLYMGGLIVCRPSAQPKLAADHVSLWISPPLYMRMNLQCELGRCVHHIGGGVHFSVIFSEIACTKIGESVFLAKRR